MRRRALLLMTACLLAVAAHAELRDGVDFKRLPAAVPTGSPGKVEVLEFFSYGCPHCYHMHPFITKWATQLPANAVFVRVPAALGRREWGTLSRMYYALEVTGNLAKLDGAVFDAIHKDHVPLFDEESLTVWVSQHGIAPDTFRQAFNSSQVTQKVLHAEELARSYSVDHVPMITVNGRYVVVAAEARDQEAVLAIASEVVARAAQEAKSAKN